MVGPARKEKAGRRTDDIFLPAVVGMTTDMLLAEEQARWEQLFQTELSAEGRLPAEVTVLPQAQAWKLAVARRMRDTHGASSGWIAERMGFSSAAYLRKLLAQS